MVPDGCSGIFPLTASHGFCVYHRVGFLRSLKTLKEEIRCNTNTLIRLNDVDMEVWSIGLHTKVMWWTRSCIAAQRLLDQMSDRYTRILFASISCDLLAALALGGRMI